MNEIPGYGTTNYGDYKKRIKTSAIIYDGGDTDCFSCKDSLNTILKKLCNTGGAGAAEEDVLDIIGNVLQDSATIDFTYNDGTPSITADVIVGGTDNTITDIVVWDGTSFKLREASSIISPAPSWQATLDVSSVLDKANTVDGGGFTFTFNNTISIETDGYLVVGSDVELRRRSLTTVSLGRSSMNSWAGAGQATAMGAGALSSLTTGTNSTAFGYGAAGAITTALDTTAFGAFALNVSTGGFNSAFGSQAGINNTTGIRNVYVGYKAGELLATGSDNVLIGFEAGLSGNLFGGGASLNVAVGKHALRQGFPSIGSINTAVGANSLMNTSGDKNTGIGAGTLENNTTGTHNFAGGYDALLANRTGHWNIGIGWNAIYQLQDGDFNIGIGHRAGGHLTTAASDFNIFIGYNAGAETGQAVNTSNSIAIGTSAITTASNQMVLGATTITETFIRGAKTTVPDYIYGELTDGSLTKRTLAEILGDLDIPPTRFGVTGEDDTANEFREFNLNGQGFQLTDGSSYLYYEEGYFEIYNTFDGIEEAGFQIGSDYFDFYTTDGANASGAISSSFGSTYISQSYSGVGTAFAQVDGDATKARVTVGARKTGVNLPFGLSVDTNLNTIQLGWGASANDWDLKGIKIDSSKNVYLDVAATDNTETNFVVRNAVTGILEVRTYASLGITSYTDEQAQDAVFNALILNNGLTGAYNDGSNTYTGELGGILLKSTTVDIDTFSFQFEGANSYHYWEDDFFELSGTNFYGYWSDSDVWMQTRNGTTSSFLNLYGSATGGNIQIALNSPEGYAHITSNNNSTLNTIGWRIESTSPTYGAYSQALVNELGISLQTKTTVGGTYQGLRIDLNNILYLDTVANDNTEDKFLMWNSTSKDVQYRTLASLGIGSQNLFQTISVAGQSDVVADSTTDILTLAAGTGMTITTNDTTDTITFTNSAPDQTVVLTAGNAIDVSGTYPNFTIDHEDTSSVANVDTVTAEVIDTLTFDTYGHVTGVTLRTLTLTDLGYSAPNIFGTIAVSGQSNVVADSATDTLTLVAGTGITITTDAGTDSITFNTTITQYTDEMAQDAVGNAFINTNTVQAVYDDATPDYSWNVLYQDSATINLSDDASGLKADLIVGAVDNTETSFMMWTGTAIELRTYASLGILAGTVTSFTFTDGNGFDGTVTNATTTPTLSLTTTVANQQVMVSNSGAISGSSGFTWSGTILHVSGSEGTGNGIIQQIYNTDNTASSIAGQRFKVGSGDEGGWFFASKAAISNYGISNGITLRAGTSSQDIGFSVGTNTAGTGAGPDLLIKSTGVVTVNDAQTSYNDFLVKGDTDANLLFADVSIDSIGFKTGTPTSHIHFNGSEAHKRTELNTSTALDITHYYTPVDASGGVVTITLPTAAGITGREYIIKKIDSSANTVTIEGDGTETLDGALNVVLYVQWDYIRIISNGANWEIIG